MIISELINEYIQQAIFHSSSDSFDPKLTKKINKAADRMIEIAEMISNQNGTDEFSNLLDHPESGVRTWASFNIIERMNPNQSSISKAIMNIEELAKSDSVDAFGAELWLKDWKNKNGM